MKKTAHNVLLINQFGNSISGRESIRLVFRNTLKKTKVFTLDFKGIHFISRSASHELLTSLKKYSDVKLINTSGETKKMLATVTASLSKPRAKRKQLETIKFKNLSDFRNFLAT